MERAVEDEYNPRILQELQRRIEEMAESARARPPTCPHCGRNMIVCRDVCPASRLSILICTSRQLACTPDPYSYKL